MARAATRVSAARRNIAVLVGLGIIPGPGGGGAVPPFVAPALNWRTPLVDGSYDSKAATYPTFAAAMRASSANKAEIDIRLLAGDNRIVAQKLDALPDGIDIVSWAGGSTLSAYTVTLEVSTDSTNGQDGTWTTVAPLKSYSGNLIVNQRIAAVLPPGPARWIRLNCTNTNASNVNGNLYVMLHRKRPGVVTDSHIMIGASREESGLPPRATEAAIRAAFPGRDPLVLNYAKSGATPDIIAPLSAEAHAALRQIADFCWIGNVMGGSVNNNRPYATISANAKTAAIRDTRQIIVDAKAAAYRGVGICSTSFRHYANTVTPDGNPQEGSLPFNTELLFPLVAELLPDAFDTSLLIPRVDQYDFVMRNRANLNADGIHDAYTQVRDYMMASWFTRIYSGTWPKAYVVSQVELAEASKSATDKTEAGYMVASLPASAAKTALQARLAAVVTV